MKPAQARCWTILITSLGMFGLVTAQDIENTLDNLKQRLEHPFSAHGQIGLLLEGYGTNGALHRRAPFYGSITANLNLSTFGVGTPFSFIYSTGGTAFNVTLPSYSFAGISPSYRDYTVHLGDRTMQLGKYSFSNHSFRGIGGEIKKQQWYSRFFYGRLQRAQVSDFGGFENVNPIFQRWGWGVLAGITPGPGTTIEFSLFGAWDDPKSLPFLLDTSVLLHADENIILTTKIVQEIKKKINLEFEYSNSAFTDDRNLESALSTNNLRSYFGLLKTNASTRWNEAFELKANYLVPFGLINLSYERIDPGYRTLGALFFQDDQENITAGITTQFLQNKISLIANGGLQRNNLGGGRADDYRRLIGTLLTNIRAANNLNISISYSNFSSVNRQIRVLDPEAPLSLTELALTNGNLNASAQWSLTK